MLFNDTLINSLVLLLTQWLDRFIVFHMLWIQLLEIAVHLLPLIKICLSRVHPCSLHFLSFSFPIVRFAFLSANLFYCLFVDVIFLAAISRKKTNSITMSLMVIAEHWDNWCAWIKWANTYSRLIQWNVVNCCKASISVLFPMNYPFNFLSVFFVFASITLTKGWYIRNYVKWQIPDGTVRLSVAK